MKLEIKNPTEDPGISFVLDQYKQLLSEQQIVCDIEYKNDDSKHHGLIVELSLHVASEIAWHLLMHAVSRGLARLKKPSIITIDGADVDLTALPEKAPHGFVDTEKH